MGVCVQVDYVHREKTENIEFYRLDNVQRNLEIQRFVGRLDNVYREKTGNGDLLVLDNVQKMKAGDDQFVWKVDGLEAEPFNFLE